MRLVTIALILLIGWVQAELWFGKSGVHRVSEMRSELGMIKPDELLVVLTPGK